MTVGIKPAERLRHNSAAPTRPAPRGRTPFDAALKSHESLLLTNAWATATALLKYHLPANDVAELTDLPPNSVVGIRRALSAADGRHTVMGRAGRPPRSFINVVQSADTHIVMSGFAVVFMGAQKARGGDRIHGEDVLSAMQFCKANGANLNAEGTTRRMLLVAQCLVQGEAEIATCRCCKSRFVRSVEGQFVPSRMEPVRGECPFCLKARMHLGESSQPAEAPAEQF